MLRHSSHQKISGLLEQADIEALLNIYHVAGMIELQRSPFDPSIVWLKNIGLTPPHG